MNEILIIVQARMESQRFPGKVLAPLAGQPMLLFLLDRLSHVQTPHRLVLASPDTPENQAIAALCMTHGYECMLVPGDPNDVLTRFTTVLGQYPAEHVIRVTGDTPLLDPQVIDGLVAYHQRQMPEPALTGIALEWGDGQDVELLKPWALCCADDQAEQASDREHVSAFLYRQPERFRIRNYPCPWNCSWLRTSIDTPADLEVVESLVQLAFAHYGLSLNFGWRDIAMIAHRVDSIREYMLARPHNQAYVEQVAREQGWSGVPAWQDLRYRTSAVSAMGQTPALDADFAQWEHERRAYWHSRGEAY